MSAAVIEPVFARAVEQRDALVEVADAQAMQPWTAAPSPARKRTRSVVRMQSAQVSQARRPGPQPDRPTTGPTGAPPRGRRTRAGDSDQSRYSFDL